MELKLKPACAIIALVSIAVAALSGCASSSAQDRVDSPPPPRTLPASARETLDLATGTLDRLLASDQGPGFKQALASARGVLVAPRFIKASFIFGGVGGNAVLVERTASGNWSAPAFFRLAGGSAGLQIGVSETAFALVLLDQHTLDSLLDGGFTFDAELLGAAVGRGREEQHSSMTYDGGAAYFSIVDGLFAGVALDGTAIMPDRKTIEALCGAEATPRAALDGNACADVPQAQKLRRILDEMTQ